MSFSFSHTRRWLAPLLCLAACGPLAGCRLLAHGATTPAGPAPATPFAGTWNDGARSALTVAPDGTVAGTLARPSAGLVFDRPASAGVLRLDVPAGAAPARLVATGPHQGTVVVLVPSAAGPAETLTLTFRLAPGGDRLRVAARSERRQETYHLTRGSDFARAE